MSAKVAICIPVKNRKEAIKIVLKNILEQDYNDYNILACDGMSIDNTIDTLLEYQQKTDGKVIGWQTKEAGYVNTHNYILSKVDAEYFCFIDSDDFVMKNKLSEQVKFLDEHPDVDVVSSMLALSDKRVLANTIVDLDNEQITKFLEENNPMNTICHFQSCMIRKKCLEKFTSGKYFFDEFETGRCGEGFLYTLHFLGYKFANIKSTVYIYNYKVMKDSMTNNINPDYADAMDQMSYEDKKVLIMDLFNKYNPQKKKKGRPKKEEKVTE